MRTTLTALLLVGLLAVPATVLADDAPATGEKAPDAGAKSTEKGKVATPSQAWQKINADARKVPYQQRRDAMKKAALAYLEAFTAKGNMALGGEALSLGFIQRGAQQWDQAASTFRTVWANAENSDGLRDQGAMHEAGLLGNKDLRAKLGDDACMKTMESLKSYADGIEDESRATMRSNIEVNLATAMEGMGKKDVAHQWRVATVKRDPMMVSRLYRSLVNGLLGSTHKLDGYAKVQAESAGLIELLAAQQAKAVDKAKAKRDEIFATLKEKNPDAIDENGNLKRTPRMSVLHRTAMNADRQFKSAQGYAKRLETAGKPFAMLGQPAPEWTLEHAYTDVKSLGDLKGKVVVMDFWATWCPWCIRSFPAIRDLLKDYADKGLVVVGVTASAGSVYAARYDLDDDLKHKATPGERVRPTARMARGPTQRPDGKTLFAPGEYQAKEKEVIKTFMDNHEMNWPVVMIDRTEPGPKYALGGWPHAVILDREGRVRYFKSGALLRDRKEQVEKFRAMLEDLLAEKAK